MGFSMGYLEEPNLNCVLGYKFNGIGFTRNNCAYYMLNGHDYLTLRCGYSWVQLFLPVSLNSCIGIISRR